MGQLMTLLTPALQRERLDDADISFQWYTDNAAAVMGHDTHNVKGSTPQKRISCKFVDSLKVMGWAQNQAEMQRVKLQSIQQKNEHGLPWDAERQGIVRRWNRCTDYASDLARGWEGLNETTKQPLPDSGGFSTFDVMNPPRNGSGARYQLSTNGCGLNNDFETTILGTVDMHMAGKLINSDGQQGNTARLVQQRIIDVEATRSAWDSMNDLTSEATRRSLLYQEQSTMSNMETHLKHTRGDSVIKQMLRECGTLKHMCLFCAKEGTIPTHDSRLHGRHDCEVSNAARQALEARRAQRLMREGRCFHADQRSLFAIGACGTFERNEHPPISELTWVLGRDVATGRGQVGRPETHVTISGNRIRCLLEGPLKQAPMIRDPSGVNFSQLVVAAIQTTLEGAHDDLAYIGQIHPAVKMWTAMTQGIEREVLQTPLTMTTGIFSSGPTFDSESVPKTHQRHWDAPFEQCDDTWAKSVLWDKNCMLCVMGGSKEKLRSIIQVIVRSVARNGIRVFLFAEADTENNSVKKNVPRGFSLSVKRTHLMSLPADTTIWAGSMGWPGAWHRDVHGAWHATEEEGTGQARRTDRGEPVGFNKNRIDVLVYSPVKGGASFEGVADRHVRSLTLLMAHISAPMSPGNDQYARIQMKQGNWRDLSLADMEAGADIDKWATARALGWQPQNLPGSDSSKEGPNLDRLRNLREMATENVIIDGLVPLALTDELELSHKAKWQEASLTDREARGTGAVLHKWPAKYLRTEAVASAARLCAGCQEDVVTLIWQPRMGMLKSLADRVGSPISLTRSMADDEEHTSCCPACDVEITKHWLVAFDEDKPGVKELFAKVGRRIMSEEAATAGKDLTEIVEAERAERKGRGRTKDKKEERKKDAYAKEYRENPKRSPGGPHDRGAAQHLTAEEQRRNEARMYATQCLRREESESASAVPDKRCQRLERPQEKVGQRARRQS